MMLKSGEMHATVLILTEAESKRRLSEGLKLQNLQFAHDLKDFNSPKWKREYDEESRLTPIIRARAMRQQPPIFPGES